MISFKLPNMNVSYYGIHVTMLFPFLAEYFEQICTGATVYSLESGEMNILLCGQGLWFGNRMDKSLINPYKCRSLVLHYVMTQLTLIES